MPPAKGSFAGVVVEDHDVQKKMRDGWQQGRDRMNTAELYGTSVSTHNAASIVIDNRHDKTRRVAQSSTTAR